MDNEDVELEISMASRKLETGKPETDVNFPSSHEGTEIRKDVVPLKELQANEDVNNFKCNTCNNSFVQKRSHATHIKRTHNVDKSIETDGLKQNNSQCALSSKTDDTENNSMSISKDQIITNVEVSKKAGDANHS